MDKPTVDELMQDILNIVALPEREVGEYTAKEIADASQGSVTAESLRHRLERSVASGTMKKRFAIIDGKKALVYSKAE